MFLLSLFGKTKPYSTKENAERHAALWLYKYVVGSYWLCGPGVTSEARGAFESSMCKEDYAACVALWNKYHHDDTARTAFIIEVKVDEPFSDKV